MTGHLATSGDDWATAVIRANGTDLLAYLARRTTLPTDAADVLGNILLVIWKRRVAIPRTPDAARMWCFGVARNCLRDYRRHGVRQLQLVDALRDNLAATFTPHANSPADAAEHSERAREVTAAVANLPERDRELVILVHWDGFSLVEAATHLRMNASTARTRYARARSRLAADLEHLDGRATTRNDAHTGSRPAAIAVVEEADLR